MPGRAQKRHRPAATRTGPDIGGWQRLAALFPDRVQHGGERLVN